MKDTSFAFGHLIDEAKLMLGSYDKDFFFFFFFFILENKEILLLTTLLDIVMTFRCGMRMFLHILKL